MKWWKRASNLRRYYIVLFTAFGMLMLGHFAAQGFAPENVADMVGQSVFWISIPAGFGFLGAMLLSEFGPKTLRERLRAFSLRLFDSTPRAP